MKLCRWKFWVAMSALHFLHRLYRKL